MARPITAGKAPAPRSRRRGLLAGSALCGATLFFALAAQAQTLPAPPAAAAIKFTTGGALPVITAPNANTLDVTLNAAQTVINWDSFHVSGLDAVTYHFNAATDIVLNKSPTMVQVDAGGHVTGLVGAATGGNIWFYSPGGVLISPNAVMTAGNFVFARGVGLDDQLFADSASPLSFLRSASDSLIQIDTITSATGASINASGDIVLTASTGDLNATTVLAAGTATVSATTGAVTIGEVTAGGAATVTAPAGAISLGQLNGSSVSATGLTTVSVTSASSTSGTGDILLSGGTSASLGSGSAGHDIKVQGHGASLGSGDAGDSVFVTATTGVATVSGTVTAGNDIEVTATTGSVGAATASLTATGSGAPDDAHVLATSTAGSVSVGSAATQGAGSHVGDITISGATGASLGSGQSSQDIKVLGPSASLGSGSAARDVFVTATTGGATVTGAVQADDDIEVTATTGSVTATTGSLTAGGAGAVGDAHVLVQSTGGSVSVGSAATQGTGAAIGDVTVIAATSASLGSGNSSRDLKVLAPTASLGSGVVARDVFVTATTGPATVTGQVVAGDDIEVTATTGSVVATGGDLKSNGTGAVGDAHVLAQSGSGSVSVGSAETQGTGAAAGDININGATSATLGSGASSRDINVLGPAAGIGSGSAVRDVFVTATTGAATVTGAVTAGDDLEVTATTGSVVASGGSLTSTGAAAVGDAHVLAQSTGGSVALGSAATQGTGAAAGDININGATAASLGSGNSSHDINVIGPSASLGSGGAKDSVFVTATTGSAAVTGSVTAGNDIEVTATTGSVTASGSLTATGVGATDDAHVLVRSTSGSVLLGSAATRGTGAAAGDIMVEGATNATVTGSLNASRDIAVSAGTGNVALGSLTAADDIAVRALAGAVTGSGDLQSGQTHDAADPDLSGAADTLVGSTLVGHSIDIKALTVAITGSVAAGRAPDAGETLGAAQVASTLNVEATNPDPTPTTAALQLATGPGKSVTAHSDISLRAENAAASSILTGDVSAGGDVAVDSAAGNITMASALAGDDVVLRAPTGLISVTGDVQSGRDSPGMTPTDSPGAGDALNAARPFSDFDGNPATVFSVVGFDVNIVSQAVHIGGATIAGREPSTDAPNVAGPVDTTTSDVRIETRVSATAPVIGLDPNIDLGSVIATRDMQIDSAKAITTGALIAGRDIAVLGRGAPTPGAAGGDHTGAGTTLGSMQAGDDALAFSVWGRTHVLGAVSSGEPLLRLVPTTDRTIDGATEAADQLAIYLHYFDLDDASAPYVLPGGVVHIVGQGVTVGGAITAHGVGSDIRILSSLDIGVTGAANAGGQAIFQTQPGGGAVKVGAVTAAGDIFIDGGGSGTGVLATGVLTSTNSQVAIRARDGTDISLAGVSAGDDVVIRSTGALTASGAITAGGGTDAAGLGDALVASDGALTLVGHAYDLTGHNVDIVADTVSTTKALTADGDVRVQTTGLVSLNKLTAGRDVLIDSGSTVTTDVLSAGRDIGVRSTGATSSVTIGDASAGDDLVIRANGSIFATGTLNSGGGTDSNAGDQAGDLMFGVAKSNLGGDLDLLGQMVDVRSSAGAITVTGPVIAATDARFQTAATTGGSVTVGAVTAARDVLLDGGGTGNGVVATGTLTATNGDVAVQGRDGTAISLAKIAAGDDVVLRTTGSVTVAGPVSAGSGADSVGLGDVLLTTDGAVTLEGQTFDLTGHDVDIVAGSVTAIGAITALGTASDVRVQSLGVISLGALTAGRDVLVDGATTTSTGLLTAGRDVGARSTGAGATLRVGGASAGDDVVLRAKGSILVSGTLKALGGADSTAADQAGDLMFNAARSTLAGSFDLVGNMVDVRSSGGSIQVQGATNAGTDARFQTQATTGGSVTVGSVTAGRDILLDGSAGLGSNGAQATGTLTATSGDVAVRGRDGSSISLADVTAGDDVVLRTNGNITGSGAVTTTGQTSTFGVGDRMIDPSEGGALSVGGMTFGLADSDIDIVGNVIGILRASAFGGVRLLAGSGSLAGGANAGTDILIDSTDSLTVGDLSASGDIALRSKNGSLTVGRLNAGDDVVLRAALGITAGMLTAGGAEHTGVGDALFSADPTALGGSFDLIGGVVDVKSASGPISIGGAMASGDVRLQTTGGAVTISGTVSAGRDVFADGGSVAATGSLTAARDVALYGRGGAVAVASVTAGNEFVVRAQGDVTATGELKVGQTPTSGGVGDRLIAAAGGSATLFGEDVDPGVGVIDLRGANITLSGAVNGTLDLRLQSTGTTTLAGATVTGDIAIDAAGDVTAGDLSAGRDIAVRSSAGALSIASGTAGDDIVLRAANAISVAGQLSAGQGADAAGAGDGLFALNPTSLGGDFDLAGGNVDLKSAAAGISILGTITAPTDVRLQALGAVVTSSVSAARDVLLDGGSVSSADIRAGRDVAVRAQTDGVALTSASAGDDIVLRAAKDVTVTGALTAGGAANSDGAGDRLFATDKTALNGDLDLAGATIDVRAHGAITVGGAASATGDARFQTVGGGAISLAAVTAGGDVLADGATVKASGALTATGDVAVRGRTGAVQLATIKAGDDIAIRAGGDVSVSGTVSSGGGASATGAADRLISAAESGAIVRLVDPTAATASIEGFTLANGDIDIKSGGAITLGGDVNAAGSASGVHLQAAGKISAGAVTAGDSIFARGSDFSLNGAWRANSARLEVTASGGLALGEGVSAPSDGVALSSSTVGMIDAATLQIFVGDSSGTMRGGTLAIGTLNIDTSKIKTSLELYAGASSQVLISGAFAPSASGANTTAVRIGAPNADVGDWTPGSIRVIADNGGSIGVSTSTGGRTFTDVRAFGSVELNATNDILIGYQDFIDKLSATAASSVAQAVKSILAPQTTGGPRMLVTAGTLTLRANGKVAQQDTEGLLGSNPTGLYLFGGSLTVPQLVLGRTSGKSVGTLSMPEFIELNGALTTGATVLTGANASLANVIAFANGVGSSAYYRLNSCTILQPGSCMSSSVRTTISIAPDSLTGLNVQDHTAQAGAADPTVASATNEEGWKDPK